ncbi:MAG TPA: AMP-binding protein [Nitrososphaera sp.]|nr:AMP-binding protein [Nitrososphaera sp.]
MQILNVSSKASLLTERFIFVPSADQIARSNIGRFMKKHDILNWCQLVKKANSDIGWYWNAVNEDLGIEWFQKYDKTYDSLAGVPWTKWFLNGKCNIVANAIDRHVKKQPDKVAYIFANEQGSRRVTYRELDEQVSRLAGALATAGIKRGDVIAIYLPMIPEAFYAIFACSKIGAVHTTIFSGFSAHALHSRLVDSKAKLLITTDAARRRGKGIDLASQWQKAVQCTNVSRIVTIGGNYDDFIKNAGKAKTEVMNSEDPLFILYTSGTTGHPKGTLQVHGGFTIVAAQQTAYLIDMNPEDILFWYADMGWVTGQVWVVYGSLIIGGTALVYDDALDYPTADTWCRLIEDHKVSIFGAAPTAIRLFMKNNVQTSRYNFQSLRILAATGEPINSEAWTWYFENVGKRRCPLINLSGGTEIGGAILSVLPVMPLKPCTVGCPVPGFDADVFDDAGKRGSQGYLVIKKPWPSMTRGLFNSPSRFLDTYWSKYKNVWYHGDIVLVNSDGLWYMQGRADDVIKVAGHRIGTAEVEAAAASHPAVAEAIAIGRPDELKGETVVVCIVVKDGHKVDSILIEEIITRVEESIGRFARPQEVRIVAELPKTRTGKLMRRLVKAKITGGNIADQDLSTVENPGSLDGI